MLSINIPPTEYYDENKEEFIRVYPTTILLEHSLLSISRWESKWAKPFLSDNKTNEEIKDYIRCMAVSKNINRHYLNILSRDFNEEIDKYINTSQSATWFNESVVNILNKTNARPVDNGVITSEVIYYMMVACQIPFECEKWHLSRLLALIRVYQEKNRDPKDIPKKDLLEQRKRLNDLRRAKLKSKG